MNHKLFFLLFEKIVSVGRWETKYFMGMAIKNKLQNGSLAFFLVTKAFVSK